MLLAQGDVAVDRLVTTVDPEGRESTAHGLLVARFDAQARSIGIPLQTIPLPGVGLDLCVEVRQVAAARMRGEGIDAVAFGGAAVAGGVGSTRPC